MVDVIQSWLGSGQHAVLNGIPVWPRRRDGLSPMPLMASGEQASAYYLSDDEDHGWILKKFFPDTQPDSAYVKAIQQLIPRRPGFESGFARQVLESSSVSGSAYAPAEFQAWIDGAIMMPEVESPSWAELSASIRERSAVLSRVERLLLCQKLSETVGWFESLDLAHRDLSGTNVLMDTLNVEIHIIDWDSLFHSSLEMPVNTTCGTSGYIAPFVRHDSIEDAGATWQINSDRFALTILNVELLTTCEGVSLSGGVSVQEDLQNGSSRNLDPVRESLRRSFPAGVEFLTRALTARSFAECPSPAEWIALAEKELSTSDQTTWEEASAHAAEVESLYTADYEPHFVEVNRAAFVKIDQSAFVRAPAAR
ncbi:MAG TPA: serine/threonine-protein kinase [Pyrinomonadaceae bacterium]|nr:serine/threonine-protein kinase [Pyrinomonadaceae bacterium]